MQCPVCHIDLIIVEHSEVELDLCLDGHGTWFDADELSMLAEREQIRDFMSSLERELPPLPGKGSRRCPRCRARMQHVQAPAQPEPVILDRCPHGHGLWFDQGELKSILGNRLESEDPGLQRLQTFLEGYANPPDSTTSEATTSNRSDKEN